MPKKFELTESERCQIFGFHKAGNNINKTLDNGLRKRFKLLYLKKHKHCAKKWLPRFLDHENCGEKKEEEKPKPHRFPCLMKSLETGVRYNVDLYSSLNLCSFDGFPE